MTTDNVFCAIERLKGLFIAVLSFCSDNRWSYTRHLNLIRDYPSGDDCCSSRPGDVYRKTVFKDMNYQADQWMFQSPQSRPNASLPPLTASSTASANFRKANISSPTSSFLLPSSFRSPGLVPRAFCSANSRSSPLSLSIEVRKAGNWSWEARIRLIWGDEAVRVMGLTCY